MLALREKFRGCIASSWIGSAMGAAVEGWTPERIQETYGILDTLQSYRHYADVTDWQRPPGTTEDGIERQRLIATAIIEKKDRIRADDLIGVWLRDLDPAKVVYKQEGFDLKLLELARAGVPPWELGRLWPYQTPVTVARASHPLGLINAGDPESAADDTFEVGKLYFREMSFGLRWAALYSAAVAEACKPDATVESVIAVADKFARYRAEGVRLYALYDTIQREVGQALELVRKHAEPAAARAEFYKRYHGGDFFNYGQSQANEVVSKGLAIFALSKGNPRDAILTAVNFGRDTDCTAAVAGGLAGSLSGAAALPEEWINQVNEATLADPYTNNRRTIEETADGLFDAYCVRHRRLKDYLEAMGNPDFLR
jgi:ADP-ribosylglycohydrolase